MATHSSILAWRIPGRKEPRRLQSTGSQRVEHDWTTSLYLFYSLAALGLHCSVWAFPLVAASRGCWCTSFSLQCLLLWNAGSRHMGFSSCSSRALDHRLGSWDARTHLIQGMRDPSRPGIKQVSPVLRGRVLTNGPPGKPHHVWTVGKTFPIRFSMNGARVRERHQPPLVSSASCTPIIAPLLPDATCRAIKSPASVLGVWERMPPSPWVFIHSHHGLLLG